MTARLGFAPGFVILASAKASIATATTTTFSFGSPADINLATQTAAAPGLGFAGTNMRVLVVFDGSITGGGGTTDSTSYILQDAADNAGAIGTPADVPAANITYAGSASIAAAVGDRLVIASVLFQPGRPWLRAKVSRASGTTDTLMTKCFLLGIPQGLL